MCVTWSWRTCILCIQICPYIRVWQWWNKLVVDWEERSVLLTHLCCTSFLSVRHDDFLLNVFHLRCCPTEHILKNTPIGDRLLVTVHETWVIYKFSWKGTQVWLICYNQRGCLLQPSINKGLKWKFFWIRIFRMCSIPRNKFNLCHHV
jgi:hypothetical protein